MAYQNDTSEDEMDDKPSKVIRIRRPLSRSSSDNSTASQNIQAPLAPTIGADMYKFLVTGDKDRISPLKADLCKFRSMEEGNTVLHIAASAGQAELIVEILPHCTGIINEKNSKGDLAFHSAAKSGHLNVLKALTCWENYGTGFEVHEHILGQVNKKMDTALHIAVRNNQIEMARLLVNKYSQACYELNSTRLSPMYLAIEGRHSELIKTMINLTKEDSVAALAAFRTGRSIVHAAIAAKNQEILKDILTSFKDLIESFDDEDRTPLSYAALIGYTEGVEYLLSQFPNCAFQCDKDGSFPIHKAARGGDVDIVRKLNNSKALVNRKGQNILHVAAEAGKSKLVSHLLSVPELERLINLKDENGNTPLHLAAEKFQPRVTYMLTRDSRVELGSQNNDGLTALDMFVIKAGSPYTFEERLTWMALRYVDAPRGSQSNRRNAAKLMNKDGKISKESIVKENIENVKTRVDTHLVMATLVATVTFAAGFTLPGAYIQSDGPDNGLAVLIHKWAFQVFVLSDTIAMYSSILAIVILIWAQLGELKLSAASLRLALPLLGFSLSLMTLAFMMGLFVVLRNLPWLSFLILGIGSVSSVAVLLFFIPLYSPSYIRSPVKRFLFSGPLLLLIYVCEKSTPEYAQ